LNEFLAIVDVGFFYVNGHENGSLPSQIISGVLTELLEVAVIVNDLVEVMGIQAYNHQALICNGSVKLRACKPILGVQVP